MITFPMIPGVEINVFLLIFIGLGAGILSGFAGVGGSFIVTPALIVLGFPASLAKARQQSQSAPLALSPMTSVSKNTPLARSRQAALAI